MNREFEITNKRTFASKDNARRAVQKAGFEDLRHFIQIIEHEFDGLRYIPVFVGQEAVQRGVHFHFNVVG